MMDKLALIEKALDHMRKYDLSFADNDLSRKAIEYLHELKAEQAEQAQPVAEKVGRISANVKDTVLRQEVMLYTDDYLPIGTAVYTAPPPRQPLTSAEIMRMACKSGLDLEPPKKMSWVEVQGRHEQLLILARAIEAAHGITGEQK